VIGAKDVARSVDEIEVGLGFRHEAAGLAGTGSDATLGGRDGIMGEKFERHRQPWTSDEIQKLHRLAAKGMSLRAISKAMTRSEESIQARAKADGLKVSKLR
jgi:hypothetical protein